LKRVLKNIIAYIVSFIFPSRVARDKQYFRLWESKRFHITPVHYDEPIAREIVAAIKMKLGIPTPLRTKDRRILEQLVFPYFVKDIHFHRILFVGCDYYTWHYRKIFQTKEYWTIEPRAIMSVFGAKRHIIGYLRQIDEHFEKDSLNVIICNGVLGYGLDDPQEIENSLGKCFFCLREGGILVLGWDIKENLFLPLDKYKSLQQFHPFVFPTLGTSKYPTGTNNHHTFSFYIKPKRHVQ
jgi:hypothetical protein